MVLGAEEGLECGAKRVYVGKCAGNHSVARRRKRWIDTVKE